MLFYEGGMTTTAWLFLSEDECPFFMGEGDLLFCFELLSQAASTISITSFVMVSLAVSLGSDLSPSSLTGAVPLSDSFDRSWE
jgi:hypothetical protein